MREEDFDNIKMLCSMERLEKDGLYLMSKNDKKTLEELRNDFDKIDKTIGKTFFYMHYFLGIDYEDIASICNYSYRTVQQRCYETKDILSD